MAEIRIKARAIGVDHIARRFTAASVRLPVEVLEGQRTIGRHAEVAFAAHAPHRGGRLIRGISSFTAGSVVTVKDEARNPETGYDYVGVTRFGHKVARIYPKHYEASVAGTGKARKGVLRFSIGGRVLYRASVRGYHPDHDWAEEALPEVQARAQMVAAKLGRSIEARF